MKPILSPRDLSSRIGVRVDQLNAIAKNIKVHYTQFPLLVGDKVRILHVPRDELKQVQRRIKTNVLDKIELSEAAHGGVRRRSARSNASQHLGRPCVVTIDVRHFFPSVRHYVVYRMFRHELGFGRDVARLLTRLTTLDGRLPQGAPTSTAVANLILAHPVDAPLSAEATRCEIRYTRFVDDITMSGKNPRPLINMVARMLSARRLRIHRDTVTKSKLRIRQRILAQEVTGLVVNSERGPSVSRKRRDNVRAAIFQFRTLPASELEAAVRSLRGRISHVRQYNGGTAQRLEKYLETVLAEA